MKIGDTVWEVMDANRLSFRERTIDGETSRSWLMQAGTRGEAKIPKNHAGPVFRESRDFGRTFFLTREAMEDFVWERENRRWINDAVHDCRDVATLRKIAAVLDGSAT